jgi:hypothetical protein
MLLPGSARPQGGGGGGVDTVVVIGGSITGDEFDSGNDETVALWFEDEGYTVTRRDQGDDNTQVTQSEGFDLAVGITFVGALYGNQDLTDTSQCPWLSLQTVGFYNTIDFTVTGASNTESGEDVAYQSGALPFEWTGETKGTDVAWTSSTGNNIFSSTGTLGPGGTVMLKDAADTDNVCAVFDVGDALANSAGDAGIRCGFLGFWLNKWDDELTAAGDQFINDLVDWLGG